MSYQKVKGASQQVSPPRVQTFQKHTPSVPAKRKVKYAK